MPIISGGGSGGSGAITRIANTVLAAPAANITISGIPGTYTHLLMVYSLRSAVAAETSALTFLRLNGDSGANYAYQQFWKQNATNSTVGPVTGDTKMGVLFETGPSAAANTYGSGQILFPFYSTGTQNRNVLTSQMLQPSTSVTTNYFGGQTDGTWFSTAAITSVAIFASDLVSNLAAGSSASLYGIT